MLMIISPSKTLNPYKPCDFATEIEQLSEYKEVQSKIKKLTTEDLKDILKISTTLAKQAHAHNSTLSAKPQKSKANRAIDLFNGDVYTTLDVTTLNKSHLEYLQDNLRIISALYGVVRPLDLIEPYRLDMGTNLPINGKSLRDYWKAHTHKAINSALQHSKAPVVNLASREYFDAIDPSKIKGDVVDASFLDMHNGNYRTVSIYAKRARGLMARYAATNNIQNPSDLKQFNLDGYKYNQSMSQEKSWVFTRGD